MLYLMKRYTRYEFNIRQNNLWRYFCFDLMSYMISVLVYFSERFSNDFGKKKNKKEWELGLIPLNLFYFLNLH